MIDRRIVLLMALLNFIVVSLCLTVIVRDKFQENGYENQISAMKIFRDSLLLVNAQLLEKGKIMEQKAQQLQSEINISTQTIQNLKTKRNEKVTQLDTMYVAGLVQFFTDFQTTDPPQ